MQVSNLYPTFSSPDGHVQMNFSMTYYNTILFVNLRIRHNFSGLYHQNIKNVCPQPKNRCLSITRSILCKTLINRVQFKQATDLQAKKSTALKVLHEGDSLNDVYQAVKVDENKLVPKVVGAYRLNQRNHTLCVGVGCNLMLSASRPYDLNVQVPKIQTGLNLLEKTD